MDKKLKNSLTVVAFGVLLFAAVTNISAVWSFIKGIMSLALPLLIGFIAAFVLNVPMSGFERFFERSFAGKKRAPGKKLIRVASLLLTLACVALVIVLVCTLVIPELVSSVKSLYDLVVERWPTWIAAVESFFEKQNIDVDWIGDKLGDLDIPKMVENVLSGTGSVISSAFTLFSSALSSISTIAIGAVLSIYALMCKDSLAAGCTKLMRAYFRDPATDYILHVSRLMNSTFSKFLSGQCVEACILGMLISIAFSIAAIPYASLTGVLTAVCAFIPYLGAFISCAVGALLVLLVEPGKFLLCIIVYLCVQFVENQFIYPHVVGTSVGLGAMWTLIAVILGGKLMGLFGMIFFIPLLAVVMALVNEHVDKVLSKKRAKKADTQTDIEAEAPETSAE